MDRFAEFALIKNGLLPFAKSVGKQPAKKRLIKRLFIFSLAFFKGVRSVSVRGPRKPDIIVYCGCTLSRRFGLASCGLRISHSARFHPSGSEHDVSFDTPWCLRETSPSKHMRVANLQNKAQQENRAWKWPNHLGKTTTSSKTVSHWPFFRWFITYRSIQNNYGQTLILSLNPSNYRTRIVLPEEWASSLKKYWSRIFDYQYRFSLEPVQANSSPLKIQTSCAKRINSVVVLATMVHADILPNQDFLAKIVRLTFMMRLCKSHV